MHIKMRIHHLEKQPKSTIFWQPGFEAVDTSLQQLDIGYLEPWMQKWTTNEVQTGSVCCEKPRK